MRAAAHRAREEILRGFKQAVTRGAKATQRFELLPAHQHVRYADPTIGRSVSPAGQARHEIEAAVLRARDVAFAREHAGRLRERDIGAAREQRLGKDHEMIREPQIVVVEKSDQFGVGERDCDIARAGLLAGIGREIVQGDAAVDRIDFA